MQLHHSIRSLTLLALATAVTGLAVPAPAEAQNSFDFLISFSEPMLAAHGTPQEAQVAHYEGWDSAIARIRKRNMPFIEVTNTSSTNDLTQFRMTIGKSVYNFSDLVLGSYAALGTTTPGITISSSAPDPDGAGPLTSGDLLVVDFANGLGPNETVRFQVDIDVDPGNPSLYAYPDYRSVFFDVNSAVNDPSNNSVLTAAFSNGGLVSTTLPDFSQSDTVYLNGGPLRSYNEMDNTEMFELTGDVPEPGAGLLVLASIGGFCGFRKRR
ncbi:MAG: PEP-CTERM sorting domain-containing protein [Planctomycetales bacterium]|nr:PEP-CTERM sorting domain-containing protein [Planctomycetales bacterium]